MKLENKKEPNLKSMSEALSLAKIVNDALKLGDSNVVPIFYPGFKLSFSAFVRASQRADSGIQSSFVDPVCVIESAN